MPNHFLAAGVYGCVYYPGYTCKGVPMKRKKWVSKLTQLNEITDTEIEIGKILKKSNYENNFILVERDCAIQQKDLTQLKEGCDMVKKTKRYVLLYSKYVHSKELYDYLKENNLVTRMFRCFYQLCEKISILIDYRIVHHDLHFGNSLYDTETANLYIIDFGLSIIVDKLKSMSYRNFVFSRYMPDWSWYTLEIHFLSYLIQHGDLTMDVVKNGIHSYLANHNVFKMFPEFTVYFKKEAMNYFLPMAEWTRESCVEHLIRFWNTWDYYDIALRFLSIYKKNSLNYPKFLESLFLMVHPNPEKRPTPLQIRNNNNKTIQSFDLSSSKMKYESVDPILSIHKKN
jgi:hypothetical protein